MGFCLIQINEWLIDCRESCRIYCSIAVMQCCYQATANKQDAALRPVSLTKTSTSTPRHEVSTLEEYCCIVTIVSECVHVTITRVIVLSLCMLIAQWSSVHSGYNGRLTEALPRIRQPSERIQPPVGAPFLKQYHNSHFLNFWLIRELNKLTITHQPTRLFFAGPVCILIPFCRSTTKETFIFS